MDVSHGGGCIAAGEVSMDFLDQVAVYAPVPAGGAAAAYVATLGMGLLHKVALLELNRTELAPAPQANFRIAQKEIERLYLDLKKTVAEDQSCFQRYAECVRTQDSAEAKLAFLDVVTCSMKVMEKSYQGLDWVARMRKNASDKLAPHLNVAAELLSAALAATAHVVRENIKPIKSPIKRGSYLKKLEELCDQGLLKKREAMDES